MPNRLPIYAVGKADPVGDIWIPDDPTEVRRETLKRLLKEVRQEIRVNLHDHGLSCFELARRFRMIHVREDRIKRLLRKCMAEEETT